MAPLAAAIRSMCDLGAQLTASTAYSEMESAVLRQYMNDHECHVF